MSLFARLLHYIKVKQIKVSVSHPVCSLEIVSRAMPLSTPTFYFILIIYAIYLSAVPQFNCSGYSTCCSLPSTVKPQFPMWKLVGYLHLPVTSVFKAPLLFVVVVIGSIFHELSLSPETPFSDVNNPLNQYFVKISWGWSLIDLLPTVFITAALFTALNWKRLLQHMSRLAVSHIIWYTVTRFFVAVDTATGTCADETTTERYTCLKSGQEWYGFDISGHVFLLTYCIYVLSEECDGIKAEIWNRYPILLQEHEIVNKLQLSVEDRELLPLWHKKATWFVKFLELLATAEVILMAVMTSATAFYFHTFVEKLLGYIFGLAAWFLTYRCLYGKPYCPSRPEEGILNPARFPVSGGELQD